MPLLEMRDIVKEFSRVRALDGVTLRSKPVNFTALVGGTARAIDLMMCFPGRLFRRAHSMVDMIGGETCFIFRVCAILKLRASRSSFRNCRSSRNDRGREYFPSARNRRVGVINWSELIIEPLVIEGPAFTARPTVQVGSLGLGLSSSSRSQGVVEERSNSRP